MPTARYGLAAATGLDGRVYAIGGAASSSGSLSTAEAYTPGTNSWATVAPMPTARFALAAATGPDGRIYAIGGDNHAGSYFSTAEAYTPGTNSWATVAPMPTARSGFAATTGPDGRIYAIGGFNGSSLSTVEAYDTGFVPPTSTPEVPLSVLLVPMGAMAVLGTLAHRRRRDRSPATA